MENKISTESSVQNEEVWMANDELSLKNIVDVIKRNQRLIIFLGIAGLLLSTAYIVLTPSKYEAHLQMQMAQFVKPHSAASLTFDYNGSVEEPVILIQRLRAPTTYPVEVQQSCGLFEGQEFGDYLDGTLKVDVIKNVVNVVEMKVHASSPEQARKCTEAIVAMISAQQSDLIKERLSGHQARLAQYQKALQEEQQQLGRIKKSEPGSFGYWDRLDKLGWLRTRIDALQGEVLISQMYPTKLIAPIYVSSKSVSPKVGLVLLCGLTLGLMLGLLFALGREGWRRAACDLL